MDYYLPNKQLSIDESMIGFTGRHELKQYMPMKSTKWGTQGNLIMRINDWVLFKA